MTAFESMACGLTVVSADVGGQRDLIIPDCGTLIPSTTPAEECDRYEEILADLLTDREKLRRMGKNSEARIRGEFRIEQMGERVEGLFRQLMARIASEPRLPISPELAKASAAVAVHGAYASRRLAQLEANVDYYSHKGRKKLVRRLARAANALAIRFLAHRPRIKKALEGTTRQFRKARDLMAEWSFSRRRAG